MAIVLCPHGIQLKNYTVRISFVLFSTALSISAIYLSVIFCAESSNSLISSSEISVALLNFLKESFASRLILRIAILAFSPFS